MRYCIDSSVDEPVMLLNQEIGPNGIDGGAFQSELMQLDTMGKSRIQVWINSPGGEVVAGMAIYNAILKAKTKVDTYNCGMAASIAAVIFQAGRKRVMSDYSILMYHNAFGGEDKALAVINVALSKMIERSGMDRNAVLAMMKKETYLTADEAVNMKLADEVECSSDLNKPRMSAVSNNRLTFHGICNMTINKKVQGKFTMLSKMLEIANKSNQAPKTEKKIMTSGDTSAAAVMLEVANRHNQK